MATIIIDGVSHTIPDGQNLLHAALSLGYDLPYFCWHPAMGSVGACRQCAVVQYRDEKDTRGRIVMACMTPATDGTRISIDAPDARQFRKNVIAWLMANHPHDCPVCDEGGECHLQDMTQMSGHNYRRYRFTKRTHRNQNLGPFINHEMNRCIACYRCVRYYRDYAGGDDLNAFAIHDSVYFGRASDGVLENEFSGNLVEVCPTGVFTDKTLGRHYTRKWDLQTAPSVCHHCSVGCNTNGGERYNMLRRITTRYNREVNGYFLCDRGRFGYEFVNSDQRIRRPLVRQARDVMPSEVTVDEAVSFVTAHASGGALIGIGSPRASVEANFALRTLVGPDRFFSGVAAPEQRLVRRVRDILAEGTIPAASLHDIEAADAVIVLGEDILNTAPMMALAVRQAARNVPNAIATGARVDLWNDNAVREIVQSKRGPVIIATPAPTRLDDAALHTIRALPDDIARFGMTLAHALAEDAPAVTGMPSHLEKTLTAVADGIRDLTKVVVISGTSLMNEQIVDAAVNLAAALRASGKEAMLAFALPECNTMGAALLEGEELERAFDLARHETGSVAVILENDLFQRTAPETVTKFFRNCSMVVAIDSLRTPTTEAADVVLPAGTFAESDGTLVNYEGRAQRFFQIMSPDPVIREGWRWVQAIRGLRAGDGVEEWRSLDHVIDALTAAMPRLAGVKDAAPGADFDLHGRQVARQSLRYTGRTAMHANVTIHEPKPPEDVDAPMRFSMEGFRPVEESALIPRFWAPGWNSIQAINKFQQEIGGLLKGGTPGVRLFSSRAAGKPSYISWVAPSAPASNEGKWLVVPLYQIFGSDELSVRGKAVAERIPAPYVALSGKEASRFGGNGGSVRVQYDDATITLPIKVVEGMPEGVAGIAVVPGVPRIVTRPANCVLSGEERRDVDA